MVEIIPAILVKDAAEFERRISLVAPYVKRVQIDIMDGKFVPNETLAPEKFPPIPSKLLVEYHLMVEKPLEYMKRIGKKDAIYEIHLESLTGASGRGGGCVRSVDEVKKDWQLLQAEAKKMKSRLALVLSPDTPVEEVAPYLKDVEFVLIMTVYPGFSGQKYLSAMEGKMKWLKERGVTVEVDGGLDIGTVRSSSKAGATLIGVASGIFAKPDIKKAIEELTKDAEEGNPQLRSS
ncbi:Ribulose-phosphate 3 epimerase family protein [uncultured archaeon]|nr:Ribulose-phosphate 3 epimerase family protein [uncultured archaeon]